MSPPHGSPRDVALPASIFATLRQELAKEAGALPTIHALHAAGYAAGSAAADGLLGGRDGDGLQTPGGVFWDRLSQALHRRGWGRLEHQAPHEGVGLLVSRDWIEAEEADEEDREQASCSFTSGYLSGLLTAGAGGPVAVLEVSCRARGDDACTFAFGSEGAIHDLYGSLLDGADLDGALASL